MEEKVTSAITQDSTQLQANNCTSSNHVNKSELDCTGSEFSTLVQQLAVEAQLTLPELKGVDDHVILRIVRQRLQAAASNTDTNDADAAALLEAMPLGFSTKDAQVDRAAKVLRLLFINDLRDLQTLINETIVLMQEQTADPRTEAHLGKIGRG